MRRLRRNRRRPRRKRRLRTRPGGSSPTWNSASGTAWRARILEAEQELDARQRALQEAASEGKGLAEAYEKMQEVHRRVEDLYARWAELEAKIPR